MTFSWSTEAAVTILRSQASWLSLFAHDDCMVPRRHDDWPRLTLNGPSLEPAPRWPPGEQWDVSKILLRTTSCLSEACLEVATSTSRSLQQTFSGLISLLPFDSQQTTNTRFHSILALSPCSLNCSSHISSLILQFTTGAIMDPSKPPSHRKQRPMSYAEASRGVNDAEPTKTAVLRRRAISHVDTAKERKSMASPEPPAPAWSTLPFTDVPVKKRNYSMELPRPPAQGEPSTSFAEIIAHKASSEIGVNNTSRVVAHKTSSQIGADDTSTVAHRRVSLKKSNHSKPAMSYADIARKNVPIQKQSTGQAPVLHNKQEIQQTLGVDKPHPVTTMTPDTPIQRESSPPKLLSDFEKVVSSTKATYNPTAPGPFDVPEPELRPWEKLPEAMSGTALQTAQITDPARKNKPLTWAGVVRGQKKATTLPPPTPCPLPAVPHLQPAAPLIPAITSHALPVTSRVENCDSPTKVAGRGKEHKTPRRQQVKENSKPGTPSSQQTGDVSRSAASKWPKISKNNSPAPGRPGNQETVSKQSTPKRNGKLEAKPRHKPVLSSSNVAANPGFATMGDRTVTMYPAGNLALSIKKKQDAELMAEQRAELGKQGQTAWLPSRHYRQPPVSSPPLNTSWPALPTKQAKMDSTNDSNMSRFEDDSVRGRSPTSRSPVYQHTTAASTDIRAKQERDRSAMRRGITKTNTKLAFLLHTLVRFTDKSKQSMAVPVRLGCARPMRRCLLEGAPTDSRGEVALVRGEASSA